MSATSDKAERFLAGSAKRCEQAESEPQPPDAQKLIRRAYSIASSSIEKEYLEFYISLVRSGALTPRLFALGLGGRLWLSPKSTGMFTLKDVPEDKHVVFIATGTGLCGNPAMIEAVTSHLTGEGFIGHSPQKPGQIHAEKFW